MDEDELDLHVVVFVFHNSDVCPGDVGNSRNGRRVKRHDIGRECCPLRSSSRVLRTDNKVISMTKKKLSAEAMTDEKWKQDIIKVPDAFTSIDKDTKVFLKELLEKKVNLAEEHFIPIIQHYKDRAIGNESKDAEISRLKADARLHKEQLIGMRITAEHDERQRILEGIDEIRKAMCAEVGRNRHGDKAYKQGISLIDELKKEAGKHG